MENTQNKKGKHDIVKCMKLIVNFISCIIKIKWYLKNLMICTEYALILSLKHLWQSEKLYMINNLIWNLIGETREQSKNWEINISHNGVCQTLFQF